MRQDGTRNKEVDGVDLHEIWKNNAILERARHPNQIQRILIHANLLCKRRRVVAAEEISPRRIDAKSKVSDSDFEKCTADDVCYCGGDTWIHLSGIVGWCV